MRLAPGAQLGPYRIAALIEAGGMGEVYRAFDTRLNRIVAIKVLPARIAGDAARRERFEREARTLSRLNHPHICVLYDVGRDGDVDFVVMEHLEGESLEERLAKRVLPLDLVLGHAVDVAEALDAAHRQGVIHGDLKPANVMLTPAGAKLLDFGLARWRAARDASVDVPARAAGSSFAVDEQALGGRAATVTEAGVIAGSLPYMAPEQLEGEEADERADIFAFGAVVYEMLTGRRAFPGATRMDTVAAILDGEPPPIRTVQPQAPHALERAVHKCLEKDPQARWQTARDLADELRWIGQTDQPTASREGAGATTSFCFRPTPAGEASTASPPVAAPWPGSRRSIVLSERGFTDGPSFCQTVATISFASRAISRPTPASTQARSIRPNAHAS